MNSPTAWLVQTGEPWPLDPKQRHLRTGYVASALARRGWNVVWWVSAFEHQRKAWMATGSAERLKLSDRITLQVLRGTGYKKNISLKRWIDHYVIAAQFKRLSKQLSPPAIIVASLPCHRLASQAVQYGQEVGCPVIVDIRDPWPDIFLSSLKTGSAIRRALHTALRVEQAKAQHACSGATAITAVSNGFLRWGLQKAGRAATASDRVFPLGYRRHDEGRRHIPDSIRESARTAEHVVTYVGSFGTSYRLEDLIDAAALLESEYGRRTLFVIAGSGEREEQLKRRAAGRSNIVFTGWLSQEEIASILAVSKLGVLPCTHISDSIPNKTFEYLSAGLPLVSSLRGELEEMLKEHQIGLTYQSGDPKALAECIRRLLSDAALYASMRHNAMRTHEGLGDEETIYKSLVAHIEHIATLRY